MAMLDQAPRTKGDLEHEVFAILAAGDRPMTLDQVRAGLGGGLMCTTVMTVLPRLQEQGRARRQWVDRAYVYSAVADADRAASGIWRLLDAGGDRRAVLARFVAMLRPDEERLLTDLLHERHG